ncbi:UNVERIFIED_CONTAM: hypothetical protein HDU68_007884 [Siphonaria sp. JEL0065]|nr:hypothetical protein HDU68_007884 [Siphonaria sp. JEL0065]
MSPVLPTLEQLLALGLNADGSIAPGFPLVVTVSPASFQFSGVDGRLVAPSSDQERRDHAAVVLAAQVLAQTSHVVAFPTETVYGLGANATNSNSVANVFKAKGRPSDNPLIVHISSLQMARDHLLPPNVDIPKQYLPVLEQHWPGPLTILLPKGPKVPHVVTAGHESVAVRMPSHPVARALIALSNCPIAAPSANTSTRPSPTLASHVQQDLNQRILLILDGGPCEGGIESTVLDALRSPPCILRPGGVTVEMISRINGFENAVVFKKGSSAVSDKELIAPVTPGMKYKHYAPRIPVVLFETPPSSAALPPSSVAPISEERQSSLEKAMEQRILQVLNDVSNQQKSELPCPRELTIGILRTQTQTPLAFSGLQQLLASKSSSTTSSASSATATPSSIPPRIHIHQESLGTTLAQVGANLFRALRELEAMEGCCIVFIEGVEEVDEGLAVMNRVRKAAGETILL